MFKRLCEVRAIAFLLAGVFAFAGGYGWDTWVGPTGPKVSCPDVLDLGEREVGEEAAARFTLVNRGRSDLIIEQIRSSCTCMGLERIENGVPVAVESLRVGPRSKTELLVRVTVRAEAGLAMRNVVSFRTNDPQRPTVTLQAIVPLVKGVVTISPTSVLLGTVPTGSVRREVIQIRDHRTPPRRVENVTTSDPSIASVRLLPVQGGAAAGGTEGYLIARAEVIFVSDKPGYFSGSVVIRLSESRREENVPFTARVVGPFEVSPVTLTLPRSSAAGQLFYADCVCRSSSCAPLTLQVESTPDGLSVTSSAVKGDPSAAIVRVSWDPGQDRGAGGVSRQVVRLRARAGDRDEVLEIPILCRKQ